MTLHPEQNEMDFYGWRDVALLPAGGRDRCDA